jgi:membrane protein YqaA with SNARE-associated domain
MAERQVQLRVVERSGGAEHQSEDGCYPGGNNHLFYLHMDELLAAVQPYIDRFGGVGMAVVAALDTSFVSMPNVNDLLIVWQTIKNPELWWYYAVMTTAGSVVGSLVIYYFGRKGGEAFLLKRFKATHVARVRAIFERYGLWAMFLVAFMPPPAPYKIFVLLAGVGGVGPGAFIVAVTAGRGARYLAEGWFAQHYGQAAAQFIRENLAEVTIWILVVVTVLGVGLLGWRLWRRRQAA